MDVSEHWKDFPLEYDSWYMTHEILCKEARRMGRMLNSFLAQAENGYALTKKQLDTVHSFWTMYSSAVHLHHENEEKIINELIKIQGKPVDIGGYYRPDFTMASNVMRPSTTFNAVIDNL